MARTYFQHIPELIKVVERANDAIMEIYKQKHVHQQTKTDDNGRQSPVTEADLRANTIILDALQAMTPDIPIVSEEQDPKLNKKAVQNGLYWIVDPLDGTKSFLMKDGQFTVNIGLVKDKTPVLGVVGIPVSGDLYFTSEIGAIRRSNGQDTAISTSDTDIVSTVVASKNHLDDETRDFIAQFGDVELIQAGSSLKLCRIAEGKAELYPRLAPTLMEWDTAAGEAVLRAAGGEVIDKTGQQLAYGKLPELRHHGFIAKSPNVSVQL